MGFLVMVQCMRERNVSPDCRLSERTECPSRARQHLLTGIATKANHSVFLTLHHNLRSFPGVAYMYFPHPAPPTPCQISCSCSCSWSSMQRYLPFLFHPNPTVRCSALRWCAVVYRKRCKTAKSVRYVDLSKEKKKKGGGGRTRETRLRFELEGRKKRRRKKRMAGKHKIQKN